MVGRPPITPDEARRRILIAMFADDELLNTLVLKGGNALALVHEIGDRASLDMDFSIANHFGDLDDAKRRIFNSLRRQFRDVGYVVFDEHFVPKPSVAGPGQPAWWGGYIVEFKLVEQELFDRHKDDLDLLRRQAAVLGPAHRRLYKIDISKNEYCVGKVKREIDHHTVYVYSLEMIAIEKLRAICQQMPEYSMTRNKTPRARDFYDIHQIVHQPHVDLGSASNRELFRYIFSAKGVPLDLLAKIGDFKNFHEPDWPAVTESISGEHENFDFYFDFVTNLALELKPWRNE